MEINDISANNGEICDENSFYVLFLTSRITPVDRQTNPCILQLMFVTTQ